MTTTNLTTLTQVRRAIDAASEVLVQVRFGVSEQWVRISKADARSLIKGRNSTPDDMEMPCGDFGSVDGTTLYLG
jgi:hypothetical protein